MTFSLYETHATDAMDLPQQVAKSVPRLVKFFFLSFFLSFSLSLSFKTERRNEGMKERKRMTGQDRISQSRTGLLRNVERVLKVLPSFQYPAQHRQTRLFIYHNIFTSPPPIPLRSFSFYERDLRIYMDGLGWVGLGFLWDK